MLNGISSSVIVRVDSYLIYSHTNSHLKKCEKLVHSQQKQEQYLEIYETYSDYVWRLIRRYGVSTADAKDLLQDVFIAIMQAYDRFQPGPGQDNGRKAWVATITRNTVVSFFRRHQRREKNRTLLSQHDTSKVTPVDEVERRQRIHQVQQVLNKLHEDKREIIVLIDFGDLSAPEAAEILKIPLNTVYSRLRTARMEFRKRFGLTQLASTPIAIGEGA